MILYILKAIAEILGYITELRLGQKEIMATLVGIDSSLTALQSATTSANDTFTATLAAINNVLAADGSIISEAQLDAVQGAIDQATNQVVAMRTRMETENALLTVRPATPVPATPVATS